MTIGAVILCGGTSRRMGGGDKTALALGEHSVLAHLLLDLPDEWEVICVGEPRPVPRQVHWTREDPPLAGPVEGLAAGVTALNDLLPKPDVVVALAGDQPFAGPAARACVAALLGPHHNGAHTADPTPRSQDVTAGQETEQGAKPTLGDRYTPPGGSMRVVDGVVARQQDGRPQLLLGAYRRDALTRAVTAASPGAGVYATLGALVVEVLPAAAEHTRDIDTPHDLAAAREITERA